MTARWGLRRLGRRLWRRRPVTRRRPLLRRRPVTRRRPLLRRRPVTRRRPLLRRRPMRRSRFDQSGQVAGIEAIPFGVLVFVVGALLAANAWAVVDAKMAVSSAAREATRAYVEAAPGTDPLAAAQAAAQEAVRGAGRDPARVRVTPVESGFTRCRQVTFEVAYPVPAITLPWIGGYGRGFTAAARHTEIVDPFRSGVPLAESRCDTAAS